MVRQLEGIISQIGCKVCEKTDDKLWPYKARYRDLSHKNAQDLTIFFDLLVVFFIDRFRHRIYQSYKMCLYVYLLNYDLNDKKLYMTILLLLMVHSRVSINLYTSRLL